MSDATKRDAVVEEFCPQRYRESPWQTIRKLAAEDMADEIARLRDENAALRAEIDRLRRILATLEGWLPDDVDRQYDALYTLCGDSDDSTIRCAVANLRNANRIIRAALVAAEQEVGRE